MPKIFISYRRDDSQHQADRVHTALRRVVPRRDIFIDVDNIPAGVDFVDHLDQKVSQCHMLLALIGPEWLSASDEAGKRRLDDPNDFVRVEIASALKRGITVAPVLLDGAPMPRASELPEDLKLLVRRNAIEVRRTSFDADAKRLTRSLGLGGGSGGKVAMLVASVAVISAAVTAGAWLVFMRDADGVKEAVGTSPPSAAAASTVNPDNDPVSKWYCSVLKADFDPVAAIKSFPLETMPDSKDSRDKEGDAVHVTLTSAGLDWSVEYRYSFSVHDTDARYDFMLSVDPRPGTMGVEEAARTWLRGFGTPVQDASGFYVGAGPLMVRDKSPPFRFAVRSAGRRAAEWFEEGDIKRAETFCK